ncbi:MAG: 50S ribosomal protein L3 N(5)-glutamine methyltransferase [Legionellales bacterium]|nr:50S ribosomal protein L3 N(5)-glutamine methyltransferase [Legionellales bacterium]
MTFSSETQDFTQILDFIRFGISQAQAANLHYGHGTDNAVDDMYALVFDSLHLPWDVAQRFLQAQLTPGEKKLLAERLAQRIIQRVPVPYITGIAHFCEMSFYVDERVLIPRSPLAELIRQQFEPWIAADQVTRILDLCTGSGCLAMACCEWFPHAQVDGADISEQALAVAEINRERHQLQDQLTLLESDCFDQIPSASYDVIISNPPYVAEAVMQTLPAEYLHEPKLALFAEQSGLAIVQRILQQAGQYLSDHGILIVEVGESAEDLINLYPDVPFVWLEFEQGGDGVFLLTARNVRNHF